MRIPASRLKGTPVFETFWRFAAERQEVFFRRVYDRPGPWTEDPILQAYKFTNAYRASDRTSQYLIKHVIYEGNPDPAEQFFRILLFKLFNKIETWELLQRSLGPPSWSGFSIDRYAAVLGAAFEAGSIYSAAYIIPSPRYGHVRKHRNHLSLIEAMMRSGLPGRLQASQSLADVFALLRAHSGIGDFLAYQFAIDLNYSTLIDHSEMSFVVPGPGALDGLRKCFGDLGRRSPADVIRCVTEQQEDEFAKRGIEFRSLWGRQLQLVDVQNLFCEVGKYARVAHPEIQGTTGRTRIKQRFGPRARVIAAWYPPKWGLNQHIQNVLHAGT